ncbi:MAG: family 43 glycosylhydrolase [Mariniphaga sp.]|nr:family 43 glycosylhydrolase [Mariniphaga sp.]
MKPFFVLIFTILIIFPCFLQAKKLPEKQIDFHPAQIWSDTNGNPINAHGGGVLYFKGIYYWYGEHKLEGKSEATFADGGIHCYSSTDLVNWKDEGIVLSVDYKDEKSDLAYGCILERPKVVFNEKNKQFVAYFKLYLKGVGYETSNVGVAVADKPNGPFTYHHKFHGGGSPKGSGDFSMFKDDDGSLYHLTVRKPDKTFVIGKMDADYYYPAGDYQVCEGIELHTEAPALVKRNGVYHLLGSGSSGWKPNAARYYTSESLLGKWTCHGNPCLGLNSVDNLGMKVTWGAQSSFILPVQGKKDAYIAMFDIWKPENPITGRYIWLPVRFENGIMSVNWHDSWNLNDPGESKISLNGIWNFKADYYDKGESQAWFSPDFNDSGWDKLQVPGNWDIRNEYADFSGKGWYRTTFETPSGIDGKVARLNFEAVGINYKAWLNGETIADVTGGYFSNYLNITNRLKAGAKNSLVVCADNSFHSGAYWSWGGIRRPVTLDINNSEFIESVKVVSVPDLQKGTAKVSFDVSAFNGDKVNEDLDLIYEVSFAGIVIKKGAKKVSLMNSSITKTSVEFFLPKKDVKLWHFDFPNLYTLKVRLRKGDVLKHEVIERFGIRKLEITNSKFLLNGESIRVMGYNWVADERLTGNTLPTELIKRDIDNMKSLGANMTRISHVPLPKEAYDYLDEKGMLVIAEIPLWGTTKLAEPENPIAKNWINQLVNNDFNHPSIIGWCVGNEIGSINLNPRVMEYVEKSITYVKDSLDRSRFVLMVSHTANNQPEDPSRFADFVSYNTYNSWGKNIDKVHEYQPDKMIFITELGENLIGEDLNSSTGNFSKMLSEIQGREYLFGASLWTYNDYRSNYRSSTLSWDGKVSQNRDWGVIDGYGNKKRAYEIIRKAFAPLKSLKVKSEENSIQVSLQPREKLDLPAYTLHEYKLLCEEFGKDYQPSKKTELVLPLINPGDQLLTKSFDANENPLLTARKVSLVSPTGYILMDTTLCYVVPEKPVIRAIFNDGVKIRVVFDHVNLATEYKLVYGEKMLNLTTVTTIDKYIEADKLTDGRNFGKTVLVQLVAINGFGETGSEIQNVTLTYGKLPPVIKAVKAFQNGISIGYSSEKNEYLYKVQYSTTSDFSSDSHLIQTTCKGACYVPDLKPGVKYYVRMCVYEQYELISPWSEIWPITI